MMHGKDILIIGGGIGGLAAGCYAQMNGYETRIYEMHDKPGGVCTSWSRKGYTIDGCIHWLYGAGPASRLYTIWQEVGVVPDQPLVLYDEFISIREPSGKAFTLYTDLDRLEAHMKALSPADSALIDSYIRAIRRFGEVELFAIPLYAPWDWVKQMPRIPDMITWGRMTMEDFAAKFRDPFLRQVFPLIHGYPPLPMAVHLTNIGSFHLGASGWPQGGSLAFSRQIAHRYQTLGGEMRYESRVNKILVENGRAIGIELEDGTEERVCDRGGTAIISGADGHATIYHLLDGQFESDRVAKYYGNIPDDASGYAVQVALGVDRDFSGEPHTISLLLESPVTIMGQEHHRITVQHYCFDPSMAPQSKSVLNVWLESSYDRWAELYKDRARYRETKQEVAEAMIDLLGAHWPGLRDQVEMIDVSTPVTTARYTGAWRGIQAWPMPKDMVGTMLKGISETLPGLADFYMVGQWATGISGLPTIVTAARSTIRKLCRRDGRPFMTHTDPA